MNKNRWIRWRVTRYALHRESEERPELTEKSRMKQKYDGTEFGRQNLKFLYAAVKRVQENRPPEL